MAAPSDIAQALAPSRFVSLAEAIDVPPSRVRQVSAFIEEHWSPVYRTTASTDLVAILLASQEQLGWKVTQRQSAASRIHNDDFMEVVQSAQIQAKDDIYNQYYPTIPGNDPIEIDGKTITGGTRITGGRREYREKTKGFAHWDVGFVKARQAALAEEASRPVRNVRKNLERVAGESLPMRRILANPRVDRHSAV
jgi:hypothetical protein